MFRKYLGSEKWRWYWNDILKPLVPVSIIMLLLNQLIYNPITVWSQILILILYAVIGLVVSVFLAPLVQTQVLRIIYDFLWNKA